MIISFESTKVLIIGDVMLDQYYMGHVNRISPEAPVPVVHVKNQSSVLGGAGNVASNVAGLKAKPTLIGFTGMDDNANAIHKLCEEKGIHFSPIVCNLPTISKSRIIAGQQQIVRFDIEETNQEIRQSYINQLEKNILDEIQNHDVVIISDYGKGLCQPTVCHTIITECQDKNIPVIVDPKGTNWKKYQGATFITPNFKEFQEICKSTFENSDDIIEIYGQEIRQKYSIENLLVTRSEKGMSHISDGKSYHRHTEAKEVFDVSGAGDTVIATLACSIGAKYNYRQSIDLANSAAGIVVAKVGTTPISLEELNSLAQSTSVSKKIYKLPDLLNKLEKLEEDSHTIVFTNGCFDILHRGHLEYLQKAKDLGSKLIIGLNSDKSVRMLKGPSRPINQEDDRALMLASLGFVDFVVLFEEETPHDLLSQIKPTILVKGGDYKIEEVVGREFAEEVHLINFVEGYSTTSIIQKMEKSN